MEFTTNFVVNCIKTRCKFMYFFDRFGTLQNLAETLKHRWLPSQMRIPRWKSRCKFHLFLVFFGVIFYNGNLWNLQRVLMEFTTNFVVNCIKTRCKFMYFFDRFGTLQNLAETLKHRWLPSQMRIPRWKSRCKFHLFLVFFGVIFYNGNLWNLQRILMEFTTDLVFCPGKRSILTSSRFVEKSHFFDFSTIFFKSRCKNFCPPQNPVVKNGFAKTLKHRWLPSHLRWQMLRKSKKSSKKKQNFLKNNHFFFSQNAETSVAAEPNASRKVA